MNELIEILLDSTKSKKHKLPIIKEKVAAGVIIDAFHPIKKLASKLSKPPVTPIDYLLEHQKIARFTFSELIDLGVIQPNQKNTDGLGLVDYCIQKNALSFFVILIKAGARLSKSSCSLAMKDSEIHKILKYHPGPDEETVQVICSRKKIDLTVVNNLILDYYDTTDGSDSEPEPVKAVSITLEQGERVAFRGIHFAPAYYSGVAREIVKQESAKSIRKTSYSQSALLDAGYHADDDIDESDKKIKKVIKKHKAFFDKLKDSPDQKEKATDSYKAPVTRNRVNFENHFYRFIQVYINAYSRLFNKGSIEHDFGFFSSNNPLVSLSWSCDKASMYGLGNRFEQGIRSIYRNPHYRRSTKKPKHPNAGYVDVFVFTKKYIKSSTVDRKDLYNKELIFLSAFYQHEEEVIAFSLVPKEYHRKRCMLSVPNLDTDFASNQAYYRKYGLKSANTLKNICDLIFNNDIDSETSLSQYHNGLKKLTEHAAIGQSASITKKIR